jgi:hypothetical protein
MKYTDQAIYGADHDVIYSEDINKLIENGIKKEDCIELAKLNWMVIEDDFLGCLV